MKIRFLGIFIGFSFLLFLVACGASPTTSSTASPDPNTIEHIPSLPQPAPTTTPTENPTTQVEPSAPLPPTPEEPVLETDSLQQPEAPLLPVHEPESEQEPTPEAKPEPISSSLPILMYHHVVPDGTECNDMTVTVSKLRQDLLWLTEHGYESILPRQLISGEPLPEKAVMITFDDGYRSNYELLFPLLQEFQQKAAISVIVCMTDYQSPNFCTWAQLKELSVSGLVEIGSHTFALHNSDGRFIPGGVNGIQRRSDESDIDFHSRVLDDIQKSHDRLEEELGVSVTCFAYPFGAEEPDAEALIEALFPVTFLTKPATADLNTGSQKLPRWTITMNTSLSSILE